jgi:hypothetical protein
MGLTSKPNSTMLPTVSRQSAVETADPLLSATMTCGLTAATALTSATWSAGSSIVVRSRPSAS